MSSDVIEVVSVSSDSEVVSFRPLVQSSVSRASVVLLTVTECCLVTYSKLCLKWSPRKKQDKAHKKKGRADATAVAAAGPFANKAVEKAGLQDRGEDHGRQTKIVFPGKTHPTADGRVKKELSTVPGKM